MSNNKKVRKTEKYESRPSNHKKQPKQSTSLRILKIFLAAVLGIVLTMGIMARMYHYKKYEVNNKR